MAAAAPATSPGATPSGAATPPAKSPAAAPLPAAPLPPGELTLIGTGHVFRVKDTIRQAIQAIHPDVVCVELDRGRLHALLQRQRDGPPDPAAPAAKAGGGFVHRRLQKFQEGVAGMYGADVGEEMLAAVQAAQDIGARVALIDPPAEDTVRRVLRELTWRERARAVGMLVGGTVSAPFRRKGSKAEVEAEIRKYQEDPASALEELRVKFPTLHRIVIAERDALMSRRVARLLPGAGHAVAVVGDGHIPGMLGFLSDLKPTVYRLADVRQGRLPRPAASLATGTTNEVGFGFDARL